MEGAPGGDAGAPTILAKWKSDFSRSFQFYLDRSTPHPVGRWLGTLGFVAIYSLRVYLIQGFYIVTYGLGIYLLNLLIGFLSPIVDPVIEGMEGPSLPTKDSDEFKPFIRRLPEFKFWYAITKAWFIAFVMTFFSIFDVPVFWPILFCYWIVLFFLTMKRQIMHMIKYKYIPFTTGKQDDLSHAPVSYFKIFVEFSPAILWLYFRREGKYCYTATGKALLFIHPTCSFLSLPFIAACSETVL